jgi:hypothetical protein
VQRTAAGTSIPPELKAFLESGVSVLVGTRSQALVPELVRAWGPRVSRDRRSVSVCIAMAGSARTLDNLRDNGRVAATFAFPVTARAMQLWGRCTGTGPAQRQDLSEVQKHRAAFVDLNERIGVPRPFVEALWQRELAGSPAMVKIQFVAEQFFDQTPGPGAGSPL